MSAVSPLTLGTVQLGMDYGIANRSGKPMGSTGMEILSAAMRHGITTLDTSRHYGESERVIGGFLAENRAEADLTIVSKFRWSAQALADRKLARHEAMASIKDTLCELGVPLLPILLYHKAADEPIDQVMRILPDTLRELQDEGLIGQGGISLYYPEEVFAVVDEDTVAALQLPVSVFDQRILHNGGLNALAERGRTVFARSVFLQGLLFLEAAEFPEKLGAGVPFINVLKDIAGQAGLDVAQLAFSYVRDLEGVSSMVLGAEHPGQVEQNVAWLATPPLPEAIREQVNTAFRHVPVHVITPGQW